MQVMLLKKKQKKPFINPFNNGISKNVIRVNIVSLFIERTLATIQKNVQLNPFMPMVLRCPKLWTVVIYIIEDNILTLAHSNSFS